MTSVAWGATYTVGSGGNYETFAVAFAAQSGVNTYQLISDLTESVAPGADEDGATIFLDGYTLTGHIYDSAADIDNFTILGPGTITNTSGNGVYFIGGGDATVVSLVTIGPVQNHGIWIEGSANTIVSYCTVHNSGTSGSASDDNIHIENSSNFIIEYNLSYSPQLGGAIDPSDSGALTNIGIIRGNKVHTGYGTVSLIKVSGDNEGSAYDVYSNIAYNSYSGIGVTGSADANIYNNTVYNMSYNGMSNLSTGTVNFTNNILHTIARGFIFNEAPATCDNNDVYNLTFYRAKVASTDYYTLTNLQDGTTYADSSIDSDPLFISATNFHLMYNSPAIGAGADLGSTYSIGLGGNDQYDCRQSDAWDLGALPYCEGGKARYNASGITGGYSAAGGTVE